MFEIIDENIHREGARIKVIGVGGAGGNAIETMISSKLSGVDFIVANTDMQALEKNRAESKIQLGEKLTRGLGAGANPDIGRQAAIESCEMLAQEFENMDMVFITAGMGGGTGTGAVSVIADIARQQGVLTVGVVTKPFSFEGRRRSLHAELGIDALKDKVDTLIIIPNDKLLTVSDRETPILSTFRKADEVLLQAVRGISDLINVHGLINLDFADIRTIMFEKGVAIMGVGSAEGENRVVEATKKAISSPLLENISIEGAKGIIINVTGDRHLSLLEVSEASSLVTKLAHKDAEIIFGAVIDDKTDKKGVRVTVIATGFSDALEDSSESKNADNSSSQLSPSFKENNEEKETPNSKECLKDLPFNHDDNHKDTEIQEKPSQRNKTKALPRDRLLMKAKNYRESQNFPNMEIKDKEETQLSMNLEEKSHHSEEKGKSFSSPFGKKSFLKSISSLFDK